MSREFCRETVDMAFKPLIALSLLLFASLAAATDQDLGFIYNGFRSANLTLDGIAECTSHGLLRLTNATKQVMGHAFYPNPIAFKNSSSINGTVFSFSTTFIFAIVSNNPTPGGHGIAFVIAPTRGLPGAIQSMHLGLFNQTNNGNDTNHVVAVELDTIDSPEFYDINDNHVGIDINGLDSKKSEPAGYYAGKDSKFTNLTLISGKPVQVWVDYNGDQKQINVTLAPINIGRPNTPLLSLSYDLSPIVKETMFVGFSSSTGTLFSSHYVLGWSFKMKGQAQELDLSQLPKLPSLRGKGTSKFLTIGLPLISIVMVSVVMVYFIRRKRKFAEVLEDWELDYGPHRFKYKDLYLATRGFRDKELLGVGGFGSVYSGILPSSKIEVAVKRVSHESRQGMKEFVAEIVSLGRLRHRNLVTLLGYCRRKGELLLVYDYMRNGSLDKYLYDQPKITLNWGQRFQIIKGVASGLLYLHEEWEQIVIHRDVKASNILLDVEFNGKLGDFGLARLYDHGSNSQTTQVAGTLGYLAPEHTRTSKATTSTDVFAFGAFLLEVACGRRPIEPRTETKDLILVDFVSACWNGGRILQACDPNLGADYVMEEMEVVLKLGLLCSHAEPVPRPSMRQVVRYLEGEVLLPDISSIGILVNGLTFAHDEGFDDFVMSYPSSMEKAYSHSSSVAESILSGGR